MFIGTRNTDHMNIVEVLKEKIRLNKEMAALVERENYLDGMSEKEIIATELHDKFCTGNHTDGCSWFYEITDGRDNWSEREHTEWYNKAVFLIKAAEELSCEPMNLLKKIVGILK